MSTHSDYERLFGLIQEAYGPQHNEGPVSATEFWYWRVGSLQLYLGREDRLRENPYVSVDGADGVIWVTRSYANPEEVFQRIQETLILGAL